MAEAMKIHLKKNAAANGLVLMERLQGLTATDVTHSRKPKEAILIFHILRGRGGKIYYQIRIYVTNIDMKLKMLNTHRDKTR